MFSCVNKGQRDNDNKGAAQSKPESKPSGKPEIKCGICGKGHLTIRCYKNPDRKQAYSAEVASGSSGSKGSNSDYGGEHEQGTQIKSEESESSRGRGHTCGRGRGYFRGRGKTDGAPRGGEHQMSFCKTEVNRQSDDGIESIYQSKTDSSLNSDSKVKEGVCYFLKSRLPTAEGTVNGRTQGTQIKSEESESSRGRGHTCGRGRGYFRGRGKTDGAPRGGGHQMSFCKTEVNRQSDDGIESIYQSKTDSSLNSDSKVKEGVCYFLKSRLPTAEGTVNGRKVEVLRDTGCTRCTVKRSLVSDDQLIGKESYVTLIDETRQRYPLAVIDVDCPFFTGKTEALCMDDTLYDLVIGNIDGSKLPEMSHFSAAAVTKSQAKQSEKAYRKLKVPDQIINEDKEALKQAQATDPKLDSIRRRVDSRNIT